MTRFSHPLEDFIAITEVDQGPLFANHIFRRKLGMDAPDFEHHVMAFYRKAEDWLVPASYVHFWLRDGVGLAGGGCTDGRAFTHMAEEHRRRISDANGLLLHAMRYGFARYGGRCEAFFGVCNDARAWAIYEEAGFERTRHEYLIAHWHRPTPEARKQELLDLAQSLRPF
jgi:hypothetical protein